MSARPESDPSGFELREPRVGELGWVVSRHGEVYGESYGWDASFEALVAGVIGEYAVDHDPRRERGWIADVGGRPAGSIFCVEFARASGYRRMVLWTDEFLTPARRLYAAAGFRLVSSRVHVAIGHENVAEDWELVL
jgi:hypothetical protein